MSNKTSNVEYDIGGVNHSGSNLIYPNNPVAKVNVDKFAYFFGVQFKIDDFSLCCLEHLPKRSVNTEYGGIILHSVRGLLSLVALLFLIFIIANTAIRDGILLSSLFVDIYSAVRAVPIYIATPVVLFLIAISYSSKIWFPLWIGAILSYFYFAVSFSPLTQLLIGFLEENARSNPTWGWLLGLVAIYFISKNFAQTHITGAVVGEQNDVRIVLKNGYTFSQNFANSQDAFDAQRHITNVCNGLMFHNATIANPTQFYGDPIRSVLPTHDRYSLASIEMERACFFDRFQAFSQAMGHWPDIRKALFSDLARVKIFSAPYRKFAWFTGNWKSIEDVIDKYKDLVSSIEDERSNKPQIYPRINDDGTLGYSGHDRRWRGFTGNYRLKSEEPDE